MSWRILGWTGAVTLALVLAHPATAQRRKKPAATKVDPTSYESLAEAKILFDSDELSAAENRLERAILGLEKTPLSLKESLELYSYLSVVRLRLGDTQGAKDAFSKAIELKPTHQISRRLASVKVLQFFERFREKELRATRASIKHSVPDRFAFGEPIKISAYVVDRTGTVVQVSVYFREKGATSEYSSTALVVDPGDETHFEGVVPYLFPDHIEPFEVEYYLAAVTASDEWVATLGSVAKPMVFALEGGKAPEQASARPKLYTRWWFWTGVGVLVAGGAAGGLYGYSATRPLPATGSAIVVIR